MLPPVHAFRPVWADRFELLDQALRAGSLVAGEWEAAAIRRLLDEGLISPLYRAPGAPCGARTYVITDGGRLAWRRDEARLRRGQLAGTIT